MMCDDGVLALLGLGAGGIIGIVVGACMANDIPNQAEVQKGYAVPSKIEIKCKDLDGNGVDETLFRYNGKQYLLKLDEKGDPVIKPYKIIVGIPEFKHYK